jgi:hypothetical protein
VQTEQILVSGNRLVLALRGLQRDPLVRPLLQSELGGRDVRASVSITEETSKLGFSFLFGTAEGDRVSGVADVVA